MLDLFIATIPPVGVRGPLLGPALVCAAARKAGFSVEQADFCIDFFNRVKHDSDLLEWINLDSSSENESELVDPVLLPAIEEWVKKIVQLRPRWVGFSIFSRRCYYVLNKITPRLLSAYPEVKIVIGGAGLISDEIPKNLLAQGSIHAYILGEGEEAIINLLNERLDSPGINGTPASEIKNLNDLPFADYSNLPIDDYGQLLGRIQGLQAKPLPAFYIEGSRGCVRKCSFCDVPYTKPGYRFRSAESIISEIKELSTKYNLAYIYFVDSLVNGSMSNLKKLCAQLEDFQNTLTDKITWRGYFITRPKHLFPAENFDMLYRAGARSISIGIESGSEKVRLDMNKTTTNEEIEFTLNQCLRVGIGVNGLFMIGYPSETQEDFQMTLSMLTQHRELLTKNPSGVSCSWQVGIKGHQSHLSLNKEKYGVNYDSKGLWYSENVNLLISTKRYFQFCEHLKQLGIFNFNRISQNRINAILKHLYGLTSADLERSEAELMQLYLDIIQVVPS